MRWLALITMLVPSAAVAQALPDRDAVLFQEAMSQNAFVEMRCRGVSPERTKRIYNKKYKPRQDHIRAAILRTRGPEYFQDSNTARDMILIGRKCSYYEGAEKRLRQALSNAERRLNIVAR